MSGRAGPGAISLLLLLLLPSPPLPPLPLLGGDAAARPRTPAEPALGCRAADARASQVLCLQAHKELMEKPGRRHVLYSVVKGKDRALSVKHRRIDGKVDSKQVAALLKRGRKAALRRLELRPRRGKAQVKLPGGNIMRARLSADGKSLRTLSFRWSGGARSHAFFPDDIMMSNYEGKISSTTRLLGIYLLTGPGVVMLTRDVQFFGKLPGRPAELLQRALEVNFYDLDGQELKTAADP
jgi:hypothetical protein